MAPAAFEVAQRLLSIAIHIALGLAFFTARPAAAASLVETCSLGFAKLAQNLNELSYPRQLREAHFVPYDASTLYESARDYNRAWKLTAHHDISGNEKHIRTAMAEGDPQIRFLEDLGFKFDFENGHKIPSMQEISNAYNARLDDLVASGKIKRSQTLKPARMFVTKINGETRYIPVELTDEPPLGAKPLIGGIHGEAFYRFLEMGYWPMGEMARGVPSNTSFAYHDLGHFGAFLRDPEFMAAIRDFAVSRVNDRRFKVPDTAVNHIFENLTVARAEKRPEFDSQLKSLGITRSQDREPWDLMKYAHELLKLPAEKVEEAVHQAYAVRHDVIQDLGGIRSDAISKHRVREPGYGTNDRATNENPKVFLEMAETAASPEERRKHFARYLTAVDHSIRIPPAEWVREITPRDRIRKDTALYRYLCTSRVFMGGSAFYNTFCL